MSRIWTVAQREYLHNLKRPAFLFSAFGTPLFIAAIWIVIFVFFGGDDAELADFDSIGVVDKSGIVESIQTPDESAYTFTVLESEAAAETEIETESIDAYYIVPEDYIETGRVTRHAPEGFPEDLDEVFRRLLLSNLSTQVEVRFPPERLLDPINSMTVVLEDTGRELDEDAVPVLILTPMFFAILFSLAMQTTSSFMMNGLASEKSNRVLEVLVTTITSSQLLYGKILGLGLLGLTQIIVWLVVAFAAFVLGPQIEMLSFLESVELPLDIAAAGIIYFVLGYFLTASILSAIGVLAGSEQQSNQYAAIVNLTGYLIPILLITQFFEDSNGTLPTLLSIIPLTSTVSMVLRIGLGAVPLWQLALSIGLLVISIIVVAWAAGKLFRWGLLMYGKKFTLRDLLAVVVGSREMGVVPSSDVNTDNMQEASA